jgi:hypothetical protein
LIEGTKNSLIQKILPMNIPTNVAIPIVERIFFPKKKKKNPTEKSIDIFFGIIIQTAIPL